jgi:hypothetical protein
MDYRGKKFQRLHGHYEKKPLDAGRWFFSKHLTGRYRPTDKLLVQALSIWFRISRSGQSPLFDIACG